MYNARDAYAARDNYPAREEMIRQMESLRDDLHRVRKDRDIAESTKAKVESELVQCKTWDRF